MIIPGLSTLKTWGLAALAAGLAIVTILWKMSQLGRIRDKVAGIKQARETETNDARITIKGLSNEQKARNDIDLTDDDRLV